MQLMMNENSRVEFLNDAIAHVTLTSGLDLTSQLIRELQVMSKVKTGSPARAFIIDFQNHYSIEEFDRVLKKTKRLSQDILVAVVSPSVERELNAFTFSSESGSTLRFFGEFTDAASWITSSVFGEVTNLHNEFLAGQEQFSSWQ